MRNEKRWKRVTREREEAAMVNITAACMTHLLIYRYLYTQSN